MPSNKLTMASERRKLQLRAVVLNNRQRVAALQEQTTRARAELKTYSKARSTATAPPLPGIRRVGV